MKNIFENVDKTVLDFFKDNNLKESDFYCRECGDLMIDVNELKDLEYFSTLKSGKKSANPCIRHKETKKTYAESEKNRWCVNGRNLSGKLFFRHLCWKCFFKKLKLTEDIARKARKSKWYAKIMNGNDAIPPGWASPSSYYKLIFDITDEELNAERAKFDTASLPSFIRRYGKDGKKKYEEYKNRQAYTCSKEYMKEKRGWTEEQWNEFNASRASTEKNFIARYGKDIGKQKWKDYCAHEAYVGCALKYFIDTYGKDEGTQKYIEVANKKGFAFKQYSNISQKLFQILDDTLKDFAKTSRWETKNFEYEFFVDNNGTKRIVKVDYYLNGKIIEFNGDFWHCNPSIYKADDFVIRKGSEKILASQQWKNDKNRITQIEKLGYRVKVVWEKDFCENQEKVIDECLEFLKS